MQIQELRPDDVEAALACAQAAGGEPRREAILPAASLIAYDDDGEPAAVMLALRGESRGIVIDVTLTARCQEPSDIQRLIDKALLKLQSRGYRKCRFRLRPEAQGAQMWSGANWLAAEPAA